QRRLQLALNHCLDELTYPLTQPDFDRVKPIVEKMDRRLRFRLQGRRRRANVGHGVVSTGAPTPGLLWVSPPGDYAIVNSNHISDGTRERERGRVPGDGHYHRLCRKVEVAAGVDRINVDGHHIMVDRRNPVRSD